MIINVGDNDGIKEGQMFRIIGKESKKVIDPDTKKELGSLQNIKAHIVAQTVYKGMTLCSSVPETTNITSMPAMFNRTTYPDLNVDPDEITGGIQSADKQIRIGDEVVEDLGQ
ncbi:hypothetical protein FC98_GL001462 [Lentilactobacillus kisonensis DSM 19906 = JCM 15041]|uniref:Uncharacterized protein n=1 Tax=Lentilactobacillus kisonensis DSM 19906 = JCM 15041 TaxID=1423766 RepID=A0A0R1NVU4_9LACO|nr:hypothetical protein FC98_GL001462 [Lentilactobacillus kisonensis DSM 19906 = JCM 15041]